MSVEAVISTQVIDTTSVGRSLMTAADAAAARTDLSLGSLATQNGTISDYLTAAAAASTYQVVLVSGTNLKTINSTSLLGSGDITVSASPGGSSGQFQWNSSGSFAGTAAVVYATTVTHVTMTAQGATIVPLVVKGAASQTGNLTEWKNSAGTTIAFINSSGRLGMNDPYSTPHSFSFEQRALLLRYNDSVTGFASFNGNTAINGSGLGLGICNGSPNYSVFSDTNSLKLGNICVSSNAIPTAPPGGASFRIVNNTLQRNDTFFIAASPVGGANNERQDGIHVMVSASSGLIAGTAAAANGGSVFIALGAAAGSGVPGSFEVRTLAGAAKFQVDGNTTSGETPLLLLDLASGTMKRVSIGAADSGGVGFKVLRVPN